MAAKTMLDRITESPRATNIYMSRTVALNLAMRLLQCLLEGTTKVRIVIRNKDKSPDIGAYAYGKSEE